MVLHALVRDDDRPARWTTVAGRKVGKAVERNRAKRRLRAVVSDATLPRGHDLVVVARRATLRQPIDEIRREFRGLVSELTCRPVQQGGEAR
jgi:ribonuclease P protein component